ncbi:N-acetylgalactosamine 6-sulfate sulfatase (GALNS) [Puteibacter caeruleilacunae]|nr:N-acetylgalactosamine 6-sulfate sulfatase (GALNS) [Puteibacter caeruleilacunae]
MRIFFKTILLLFIASAACAQKPNIVFIFADDWGYGDLGCHGSTFCKTPNLDKMVDEGIDFQNFSVSNPVCSPSRTAVMTGHFPARHHVHGHFATVQSHVKRNMPDWLDPKAPLLTKMLKNAGYATGHFGKWHLTNTPVPDAPSPTEYGIDEFGAFNWSGEQMNVEHTIPLTLDFIRKHKDQPFYINVWMHDTHTPHYPKEKYLKRFKHLGEQQQVYAAVVAEADEKIGKIFSLLKELNLDEKTIVVFSSDNGPEITGSRKIIKDASTGPGLGTYYSVGETAGLKGRKRSLFAGGVRVPCVVRWPGVAAPGKVDQQSKLVAVDLLPTFMELAGAKLPKGYRPDGESFVKAIKTGDFNRSKPIFWEWRFWKEKEGFWANLGVQDGDWKLLLNEKLNRAELYNISRDLKEQQDVAKDNPQITARLKKKVLAWKKSLPTEVPDCYSKERR